MSYLKERRHHVNVQVIDNLNGKPAEVYKMVAIMSATQDQRSTNLQNLSGNREKNIPHTLLFQNKIYKTF